MSEPKTFVVEETEISPSKRLAVQQVAAVDELASKDTVERLSKGVNFGSQGC